MMTLSELFGRQIFPDVEVTGITADSRKVQSGFVFAAMPGTAVDGAKYIPQAEEAGAVAVIAPEGVTANVPVFTSTDSRHLLAVVASRFHGQRQPKIVAGVTGTNGKTSVAQFAQQIWSLCGRKSASMGTLGVHGDEFERELHHTTPDPVEVHAVLDELQTEGFTHLALEASSHGLTQRRIDGVKVSIAAFTNITRDHLDYHPTFDDYFRAKVRLFSEVLMDKGAAVIDMDGPNAPVLVEIAQSRRARVLRTGRNGSAVRILKAEAKPHGLECRFEISGRVISVDLPLVGEFQASNVAVAAGIALASGEKPDAIGKALKNLNGVRGRMEAAGKARGAAVYVDYAHTPDAVATALKALRPHVEGRLIALVGAGGDRDTEKRPMMGAAAAENADLVIVTDDNPRSEDPADIRRAVMEGAPSAIEIGDRKKAIFHGVGEMEPGDIFAILGKGHETGQTAKGVTTPHDDVAVARAACAERGGQ